MVSISYTVSLHDALPMYYWHLGVKEYWIVDHERRAMLVLRRGRKKWSEQIVKEDETYTTKLLPGFALDLAAVFARSEARRVEDIDMCSTDGDTIMPRTEI